MINYSLMFACSQDGFIAKKEGDNPSLWTSKEDHQLLSDQISISDWCVMGRKTHELNLSHYGFLQDRTANPVHQTTLVQPVLAFPSKRHHGI